MKLRYVLAGLGLFLAGCGSSTGTANAPAAPDNSKAPAAAPTKTVKPAPVVVLTVDGTGTKTTQKFNVKSDWDLHWTYDCTAFGNSGNFIVSATGASVTGVNQLGPKGEGTEHFHSGGDGVYLEVISECAWHLDATAF